jgi:hypothetical protein
MMGGIISPSRLEFISSLFVEGSSEVGSGLADLFVLSFCFDPRLGGESLRFTEA